MKQHSKKLILGLLFIFTAISSFCQTESDEKDYYKWFDEIVGSENIGLFDGTRFNQKYRTLNGNHNYYLSSKFILGNIVYDDQPYYDIEMKYDIFDDEIIVNLPIQTGYSSFQLIYDKIDSFYLDDRQFIKLSNYNNSKNVISGFYEISFQDSNLILYKRHIKIRKEYYYKKNVYSEFSSGDVYLLKFNNTYYQLDSKKDFIKIFPKQKKEINEFYNTYKRLLKSNYDSFMTQLTLGISSSIVNNSSGS